MLYFYAIISALFAIFSLLTNIAAGLNLIWIVPLTFVGTYITLLLIQLIISVIAIAVVDVNKPVSSSSKGFRFLIRLLLDVLVPLFKVKIHSTGLDKVPNDCRFLLVSNHLFDVDPAVFMHALPNLEIGFVGKKEIYRDMKLVSRAMHKLNGFPIDRENARNAVATINAAAENIKNDVCSMAIFPEGYCSTTGELLPFRNGAFKIAKKAHCPIVVATVKNTRAVLKNMFRRTTDVYLDILTVIDKETVDELSTAELGDKVYEIMSNNLKTKR